MVLGLGFRCFRVWGVSRCFGLVRHDPTFECSGARALLCLNLIKTFQGTLKEALHRALKV